MPKRNPFNIQEQTEKALDENSVVSEAKGNISNVCMIRQISLNNRFYKTEALDSLVALSKKQPVKSFIDHDMFGASALNLLGEFTNLQRIGDAVYGDLYVLEKSKGKDLLFDVAKNRPALLGFSINARGEFEEENDEQGREVVKEIVAIRSCDLVGEPATTHGVFEADKSWYEYAESDWTNAYVRNLPDASFAWIEPGGKLDEEGKTAPRALRHLPYKDENGVINYIYVNMALENLNNVKNMPKETREEVRNKLESIVEESIEIPIGEPYSMKNPPATVKNLPSGAQRIFIDVFNRTLKDSGDETKARMAAWGAVKNVYTRTSGGTWVRKTKEGGEIEMDKVINYFSAKIDNWSALNDDAKEDAIITWTSTTLSELDQIPSLREKLASTEEELKKTKEELASISSQLAEARAKVDAFETRDKEASAKAARIDLIVKVSQEEKASEEHMSEVFKQILVELPESETVESKIRDLIKDRMAIVSKAEESKVTDSGHEQNLGEEKHTEDVEAKKKAFYEDLKSGL